MTRPAQENSEPLAGRGEGLVVVVNESGAEPDGTISIRPARIVA